MNESESLSGELDDFTSQKNPERQQLDEQNTKLKYINPLLSILGWPLSRTEPTEDGVEVEMEYKMDIGSSSSGVKVDYALLIDGHPRAFVEAKRQSRTLTDNDRKQIQSYMRQERVIWGLLTNGYEYELYKYKHHASYVDDTGEILYTSFPLNQLSDESDKLSVLSTESLLSGRSSEVSSEIEQVQKARRRIEQEKDDLREAFRSDLSRIVGSLPDELKESTASAAINTLETELKNRSQKLEAEAEVEEDSKSVEIETKALQDMGFRGNDSIRIVPGSGGIEGFLKPYKAWASSIKTNPDAVGIAIYSTKPDQQIQYIARIDRVIPLSEFEEIQGEDFSTEDWYTENKKAILFDEVYELPSPIPFHDDNYESKLEGDAYGAKVLNSRIPFRAFQEASSVKELFDVAEN